MRKYALHTGFVITSANKNFSFTWGATPKSYDITEGTYQTVYELAQAVQDSFGADPYTITFVASGDEFKTFFSAAVSSSLMSGDVAEYLGFDGTETGTFFSATNYPKRMVILNGIGNDTADAPLTASMAMTHGNSAVSKISASKRLRSLQLHDLDADKCDRVLDIWDAGITGLCVYVDDDYELLQPGDRYDLFDSCKFSFDNPNLSFQQFGPRLAFRYSTTLSLIRDE